MTDQGRKSSFKKHGRCLYAAAIIVCAALLAGALCLIRFMRRSGIERQDSRQKAYSVGAVVSLNCSEVQYLSCTKGSVSFSCTNNGEDNKTLEFCIRGYLRGEKIDADHFIRQSYRITTKGSAYDTGAGECMYDMFTIYMDGAETNEINIPNDQKEHIVVIDFQKFSDMGIQLEGVWELAQVLSFAME